MQDKNIKYSLFTSSFLLTLGTQIASSILGPLKLEFPDVPELQIQLVFTLVTLVNCLAGLFCGLFVRRKKPVLVFGLICFTVGGLLCCTARNIPMLLAFRVLTGLGIGLLNPLTNGYISDLTTLEERPKMLSISAALCQAGSVLAIWAAGALSMYNWRYSFLLFAIGIIPTVMVIRYLPAVNAVPPSQNGGLRLGKSIITFGIMHFLLGCIHNSTFVYLSIWMTDSGFTSAQSGLAIALAAAGPMLLSWSIPHFLKRFSGYVMPLIWGVIAVLYVLIANAASVPMFSVCMFFMGTCGCIMGVSINSMALQEADQNTSVLYISICIAANSLGAFTCPYVFDLIGKLLGNTSIPFGFMVGAVESLIMIGVTFIVANKLHLTPKYQKALEK